MLNTMSLSVTAAAQLRASSSRFLGIVSIKLLNTVTVNDCTAERVSRVKKPWDSITTYERKLHKISNSIAT